jgi:large subunit ribosomal protein L15
MQAHQLKPPAGARHPRRRIGRGNAAGQGTYAGRGLKGQKARAGNKPRRFFEGGQTRLFKKLPFRRGFTNPFRVEYQAVNLSDLQRLDGETEITPELLKERGILRNLRKPVKVLASGDLTRKLTVSAHAFSIAAKEKIEVVGGTVVELGERKKKRTRDRTSSAKPEASSETAKQSETEEQAEASKEPAEETKPEGEANGDGE